MAVSLISHGRVGETVANHPSSRAKRRPDRLFDMGPSGREVQQRLAGRIPTPGLAGDQELADFLGPGGSSRLARRQVVDARRRQGLGQALDMGRFAGALAAFESDEPGRHHLVSPEAS